MSDNETLKKRCIAQQKELEFLRSQVEITVKLPDETWLNSAIRRYKLKKKYKEQVKMCHKLADECESQIPENFKSFLKELSGAPWPASNKPCLNYNGGSCEKKFYHTVRKRQ